MVGRLRTRLGLVGFRLREPVGDFALLGLIREAPFALPAAYLDLLRATNGGAGSVRGLPVPGPGAIYLTPAEQVLSEHRGWGVDEHAPDQLLFATDGEGRFYLFDDSPAGRVRICRSAEVSNPASWQVACESFDELIAALGAPPAPEDP